MFILPRFDCLGINLSYTDRILRANITSSDDCKACVLLFGVILHTLRNCWRAFSVGIALTFFQNSFQAIHKSFNLSVRPGMELGGSNVIDLVWFSEVFKLSSCKLASIVRHYDVYYIKSCEHLMKKFYGGFWSCVFTSMYLGPLWEIVDDIEIVKSLQRPVNSVCILNHGKFILG